MAQPHPLITSEPGLPREILALLGGQPQLMPQIPPIDPLAVAGDDQEAGKQEMLRDLFNLSRKLRFDPERSEEMEQIAAMFERLGRSMT